MVIGFLGTLATALFSTTNGIVEFGPQFLIECVMIVIVFWFFDLIFHFSKGVK